MKKALSIFYTDDDQDDQDFFKEVLLDIEEHHTLTIHNNGLELISHLKNLPPVPDVIFLDLNMPYQNGFDTLEEIKADEMLCRIPIIIFSTSEDNLTVNKTRKMGANLYLTKPSNFVELKRLVRYGLSIDWAIFKPEDQNFVYRN